MTIQQVIDRIIADIPGGVLKETVDTVKTGDPNQPVTGVVSTFMATAQVIQQAGNRGANLIITHEPTFYNHLDAVGHWQGDRVYEAKRRLLDENGIVVWRFHDYWHRHEPDGILAGVLDELEWNRFADPERPNVCIVPETELQKVINMLKSTFEIPQVRVVGDPGMACSRIAFLPGAVGGPRQLSFLSENEDVEVLVCGEVNEWETTEYVRDASLVGRPLALVVLGHASSEEPGMRWLVNWLKPRIPGIPVTHIPATDPFVMR